VMPLVPFPPPPTPNDTTRPYRPDYGIT
jgi:hypothetical protein